MSLFEPIEAIIEAYDQPYFIKPVLASQSLFLQQQLADWIHQIYFDQKKFNQLSVVKLIQSPLDAMKPTNIACSIIYSIIRQKVQQVCRYIRQMIISSYRRLMLKRQLNCDLKHSSDSWNMNFYKFRKANLQSNMNKVYGPIAHIICTYHNSLLDSNKEVYDLWKFLYQCSEVKDLEFKALQSSLNQLILEELMQDYPNNQMNPKHVMPTLSSFQKHQFIFKEMWGFQKRKLAVQFHSKSNQVALNDTQKQQKQIKSAVPQDPNIPKKVQKGKVLSPPKPIPISLKQVGVNTFANKSTSSQVSTLNKQPNAKSQKQLAKKKALDNQIQLVQLQQLVQGLDSETKLKIFQQVLQFKKDPKQKQQTIKNIQKMILGNLSPQQKTLLQQRIVNSINKSVPIEIEIQGSDQQTDQQEQDDQQGDHIIYQDENGNFSFNQDLSLNDLQYIGELEKIKGNSINQKNYKQFKQKAITMKQTNILTEVRQKLEKINQNLQKTITQYTHDNHNLINSVGPNKGQNIAISSSTAGINESQKQSLPDLIPIMKHKISQNKKIPDLIPIKIKRQMVETQLHQHTTEQMRNKMSPQAYSLKLQTQGNTIFNKQSLYERFYRSVNQLKEIEENNSSMKKSLMARKISKKQGKKQSLNSSTLIQREDSTQIYNGRYNYDLLSALNKFEQMKQATNNKQKNSISHSLSYLASNKISKLQKMSQQEIVDQIYQIAKQKQKRGGNLKKGDIKLTYKKISYQLKSGDEKNQIKITKGSITADDFQNGSWFEQSQSRTKYQLSQNFEFGEKLIDEPNEELYPNQEKQQKKKKKKKKKKNKNGKKQGSDELNNQFERKLSMSSINEQADLQSLQQFKRKSIVDMNDFRNILSWPQDVDIRDVIEKSEIMQRMRQHQLLMQKKLQIYQKGGQKKTIQKQIKIKKQILNEQEMKIFKFLDNLQIKDQNRQKCVITQETIQKILYKRKQIRSKEIFNKYSNRTEHASLSNHKNNQNELSQRKNDLSNPKGVKPKNKKKKK